MPKARKEGNPWTELEQLPKLPTKFEVAVVLAVLPVVVVLNFAGFLIGVFVKGTWGGFLRGWEDM